MQILFQYRTQSLTAKKNKFSTIFSSLTKITAQSSSQKFRSSLYSLNPSGMTNYPIGPNWTPICIILPVHITFMPMQTGRPIQTEQL